MKNKVTILVVLLLVMASFSGCIASGPPASVPEIVEPGRENGENQGVPYEDLQTDTGRYVGQIDNNFIEIMISGVPEEMAFRSFMLSPELRENFDVLALETDQQIKFQFYENNQNQLVVVDIQGM
jgi:predicted small lipoprotein YifL